MTAFYMSRLVFMTFFGEKKWGSSEHEETEADEETEAEKTRHRRT